MSTSSEHRDAQRAPITSGLRFWLWSSERKVDAGEISTSGIFLRTSEIQAEGAHVTVRIELPGSQGMTVLGRVVRTVKGGLLDVAGMGIRFLDLGPAQREVISQFVAQRAALSAA